jgi:hypothetical protein
MRVALLFVIALFGAVAAFGAAVEQTAMADVDNENLSVEEFDSAPFVPQQNEADEVTSTTGSLSGTLCSLSLSLTHSLAHCSMCR